MNILILEDDWLIAEVLEEYLTELGCDITGPAMTIPAALELLTLARPDVAVLDTTIGSDTCHRVLEECKRQGIPIIISSGHAVEQLPVFAQGLPVLPKPYTADDVRRALDQVRPLTERPL